jgi:alkanesulfonate monooxygenase SsuD/methylene tetrahydromethanopterin reductase-like flavin-dependent oxidoreductase (luciferase family)
MGPLAPAARRLTGLGLCLERPEPRRDNGEVLAQATTAATAAERLGFTSVWVTETSAELPDAVPYESFSLLGALAVPTVAVHLGAVAEPDQRRAPSILAKIVTGIDVISHGRAVLSLDGDRSNPADAERLVEALEVTRAVLEDEHPTVEGRIYSVADAVNRPAPVQSDGVPLVVFLHHPGRGAAVLDACARSADAVVVGGGIAEVEEAVSFVGGWVGDRVRPGDRLAVLGWRTVQADGLPDGFVSAVRDAGADGCLVGVPAPWSEEQVADLGVSW